MRVSVLRVSRQASKVNDQRVIAVQGTRPLYGPGGAARNVFVLLFLLGYFGASCILRLIIQSRCAFREQVGSTVVGSEEPHVFFCVIVLTPFANLSTLFKALDGIDQSPGTIFGLPPFYDATVVHKQTSAKQHCYLGVVRSEWHGGPAASLPKETHRWLVGGCVAFGLV